MLGWWSMVRFAHLVSAMLWVGGQLTISAVLLPVVRRGLEPQVRPVVLGGVGRRFGQLTVLVFLPVQVGTGVALAWHHGVTLSSLADPGYGRTLAAKLVAFALVMSVAGGHGWAMGAGRAVLARSLAVASLVGSLAVVLLASALVRS